jgi:hypothetical protein
MEEGVQEFRSSGVQEFRSSGVQEYLALKNKQQSQARFVPPLDFKIKPARFQCCATPLFHLPNAPILQYSNTPFPPALLDSSGRPLPKILQLLNSCNS